MTGHLRVKKNYYYAVLNVKDEHGKRHQKWIRTGVKVKNKKTEEEAMTILYRLKAEYGKSNTVHSKEILFGLYVLLAGYHQRKD